MKQHLIDSTGYDLPYRSLRKHEFVLSCKRLQKEKGIRALDVAKRLLDYGLHPPTIYFPLIVQEALMIEPTESESKKDLDTYISALKSIAQEDAEVVKSAPHHTPVRRIDEVGATRHPVLTWNMD
jgi:glycine dehydrogenase subunit 2